MPTRPYIKKRSGNRHLGNVAFQNRRAFRRPHLDNSDCLSVAAAALGVHLPVFEVRDPDEFEGTFAAMTTEGAGALIVFPDSLFNANRARIRGDRGQEPAPGAVRR